MVPWDFYMSALKRQTMIPVTMPPFGTAENCSGRIYHLSVPNGQARTSMINPCFAASQSNRYAHSVLSLFDGQWN